MLCLAYCIFSIGNTHNIRHDFDAWDVVIIQVEARTQEAPPEGTVVLTASVVDARTVSVYWTRPSQANGQLFFDVYFEGYFYADPGRDQVHISVCA